MMRALVFPATNLAPKTPHELYQQLPPPPRYTEDESTRLSNSVRPPEIEMPNADADADFIIDTDADFTVDTDADCSADTVTDGVTPTVRRTLSVIEGSRSHLDLGTWPPCEVAGFLRTAKCEDRFATLRACIGGDQVQLALVADGHGGAVAARTCKERLLPMLVEAAASDASAAGLTAAAAAAFTAMHTLLHAADGCTDGCAVTVVAVNETRRVLVCANVGDCFAIVIPGRREGADSASAAPPYELLTTNDRLEDNPAEVKRARAAGCIIGQALDAKRNPHGPLRGWPGGLTCARALGDADCGEWLVPEPHVKVAEFGPGSHLCILIGSDGVWDAIEPAIVAAVARHAPGVQRCVEAVVNKATNAQHAYVTADWNTPTDDTTAVAITVGLGVNGISAGQLSPQCKTGSGRYRWRPSLWGSKSQRTGGTSSNRSVGSAMSEQS